MRAAYPDRPSSPSNGRRRRGSRVTGSYHCIYPSHSFQGAAPLSHSELRCCLSRRVSIGCQKPRCTQAANWPSAARLSMGSFSHTVSWPSISSSTLGSRTKNPPLIRPPSAVGFSSKEATRVPLRHDAAEARRRPHAGHGGLAAMTRHGRRVPRRCRCWPGRLRRSCKTVRRHSSTCATCSSRPPVMLSSPVSTSVTFHGSLRQS